MMRSWTQQKLDQSRTYVFVEGLGVVTGVIGGECRPRGTAGDFFRRPKRGILHFDLLEESVRGVEMVEY